MRGIVLYTLLSLDGAVDHPGRYFTGSRPDGIADVEVACERRRRTGPSRQLKP